jgi:penicillin-binding protein 1A
VHFVRRVTTTGGKVLYEYRHDGVPRVIRAEHVAMMNAMMADTLKYGTARNADFGWPAAGKTGTSQNSRDAWFVGYTANLTTGVWFGNDDGTPTRSVTGGTLPALAWKEFMIAAHEGVPIARLPGGLWSAPAPDGAPLPVSRPRRDETADEPTASVRRPTPPAGVGDAGRGGQGASLLDFLLGRQR